ncbi:MAG TPA: hypothetical protein VEO95_06905 [Chthoniobacteraceae bacterium]|nr:hypothetical protein [Chthoniobacteraceae bacterium]
MNFAINRLLVMQLVTINRKQARFLTQTKVRIGAGKTNGVISGGILDRPGSTPPVESAFASFARFPQPIELAHPAGFEPTTGGLEIRASHRVNARFFVLA